MTHIALRVRPAPGPLGAAVRMAARRWEALGETRAAVWVALVAALGAINGVASDFTLDDEGVIVKNPLVHHFSALWQSFGQPYWPEATKAGQYRPLAIGSFALDWFLSGGSSHWMHAVNILWHVAMCVLVWRLLRDIMPTGGALVGALYFALQPVHVEAIANTVGRCDVMAATFVVAGVLAHRRGHWAAVPFYAAALASKEMGIVMLGLVAANDLLIGGVGKASAVPVAASGWAARTLPLHVPSGQIPLQGRALWRQRWPLYLGYLGVAGLYGVALAVVFRHRPFVESAPAWYHASTVDRWLTEARVVPEYVRLMIAPFELRIEYSPRAIDLARSINVLVALGFALIAVSACCVVYCWRRAPAISFGLAWFAIAVSPVSNVLFASGVVLAERTLYLPSVGAAIVAGWLAAALAARLAAAGRRRRRRRIFAWRRLRLWRAWRVVGALSTIGLSAFAVRSWTRTAVWHDDKRLLLKSLELEPDSYRTHVRAAIILDQRHDWAGAERELAIARTLYPEDANVYEAAAMVADRQNEFGLADRLYDSANQIMPGQYDVYIKQARLRFRSQNYAGAIQSARAAYLTSRDSVGALNILTGAAQRLGDIASADWAFRRGLADHPRDTALHRQYSWMLAATGDTAASRREAERAAAGVGGPGSGVRGNKPQGQ
jgi:Tfp pilus assembly protein PilF